jgi:hypothetical protein
MALDERAHWRFDYRQMVKVNSYHTADEYDFELNHNGKQNEPQIVS